MWMCVFFFFGLVMTCARCASTNPCSDWHRHNFVLYTRKWLFLCVWRIFLYELNAMAPTWLPKSHSPTAIKAAKSGIFPHYGAICGGFFPPFCSGMFNIALNIFFLLSLIRCSHPRFVLHRFGRWVIFLSKQTFSMHWTLIWFGQHDKKRERYQNWNQPFTMYIRCRPCHFVHIKYVMESVSFMWTLHGMKSVQTVHCTMTNRQKSIQPNVTKCIKN